MKDFSLNELIKLRDSGRVSDDIISHIEILQNAINDWPQRIETLDDFELSVKNFVGDEVTKKEVERCLSRIDFPRTLGRQRH